MIRVIATLTIDPSALEDVVNAAFPCIDATRKEPGCIGYDLHASLTDPAKLVMVEAWETREDLERHFGTDHLKTWREASAAHIRSRKVEIIHPDHVEQL